MPNNLLAYVDVLLHEKKERPLKTLLLLQDFHTIGALIDDLEFGKRKVFSLLPPEIQAEVALVISHASSGRILPRLSDHTIARFLHFSDEDDATDILQILPAERRHSILQKMKTEKRRKIEKLLAYGAETAGGLMDLNFIIVKPLFLLRDVAEKVRSHLKSHVEHPTILVTTENGKVLGVLPTRNLLFKAPDMRVADLVRPVAQISHTLDREKILDLIAGSKNEVICVVDQKQNILGVIRMADLLKVAEAEATEDVYRFAGVDTEEEATDSIFAKVGRRYVWLILNLITAFLASLVVAQFQGAIAKLALLAVFMPVVAGEGGNAGTQALAVVVRALAMGDVTWGQGARIAAREAVAGMLNGAIVGAIASGVAIAFGAPAMLGAILGISLVVNCFIAGLFGASVPLILRRMSVDPAVASSIFVTTATDIFGFLTFLGLGAMFLL